MSYPARADIIDPRAAPTVLRKMESPYGKNSNPFDRLREPKPETDGVPQTRDELKQRLSGGLQSKGMPPEMKRMWVLCIILFFVVSVMAVMWSQMRGIPAAAPGGEGRPRVDETQLLKKIQKAAQAFEDGPQRPTLGVGGEIGRYVLQLGPRGASARCKPAAVADLAAHPADHRGEFVRVEGLTVKRAFEEAGAHSKGVWLWEMEGGALVYHDAEPPAGPLVVEGVFLRSYTAEGQLPAPVIFARNVKARPDPSAAVLPPVPDAEEDILRELTETAQRFEDGEKPLNVNDPDMLKVMALVEALPPRTVSSRTENVRWMDLAKKPSEYRGRFVRLDGRGIEAYLDEQPGGGEPDPLRPVNQVYMEDVASFNTVIFYFVNYGEWTDDKKSVNRRIMFEIQPGEWEGVTRNFIKDYLAVEGVFLRTITYESQLKANGEFRKRTAVVLYVRNIAKRPAPEKLTESMFMAYVVAGIVTIVLFIIGLSWYFKKQSGEDLPMRLRTAQIRRAAVKNGEGILGDEAKPPAPEPPPPAPPAG